MHRKHVVGLLTAIVVLLFMSLRPMQHRLSCALVGDSSEVESIQRLIDEYEKTHPNVKITLESIPWDEYWQSFLYDCWGALISCSWSPVTYTALCRNECPLDLREPFVSQEVIDEMYPPHREMVTYEGKITAMPFTLTTVTPFYNRITLQLQVRASYDAGGTWLEELVRSAKMKQARYSYGVNLGTRDFALAIHLSKWWGRNK